MPRGDVLRCRTMCAMCWWFDHHEDRSHWPIWMWYGLLFTARKQSLRRLCFYTCLSVILFTEGEVPGQVSPSGQVHPLGRYTPLGMYTPRAGTPPGRYTPWAGTPPGQVHPLGAVHAGKYEKQAGGTHPTGMHSCVGSVITICIIVCVTDTKEINFM